MDKGLQPVPACVVTLRREIPIRMAVTGGTSVARPLIEPMAAHATAVAAYTAPVRFDWRRDEPLARVPAR